MFQTNEIINLIISIGILLFIVIFWSELSGVYHLKVLTIAFLFMLASGIATVVETVFTPTLFNFIEHFCDVLRTAAFLIWACLLRLRP
jgi:hypothetical protein